MKTLFNIQNEGAPSDACLLIAAGGEQAGFAITDASGAGLYRLQWFQWNGEEFGELAAAIAASGIGAFSRVSVMPSYDAFLVPSGGNSPDYPFLLNLLVAPPADHGICRDDIPEWQLVNYYTAPSGLLNWVKQNWPQARWINRHTVAVRSGGATTEAGCLQVNMGYGQFTVTLTRNGRLWLSEDVPYQTPEDVLFYLLQVCRHFGLSQQETRLRLSGFIDRQSALFTELYQYFLHTEFTDNTWNTGEYPDHFFTSLNQLSACA